MKTRLTLLSLSVLVGGFTCFPGAPSSLWAGQPVALESGVVVDLTFSDKYPEAPAVLKKACHDNPGPVVTTASLVQVFEAAKAPMEHREGVAVKAEGAHSSEVLQATSEGILVWGPYAELEQGRYWVVYRFRLEEAPVAGSALFLDVAHKACTTSGEKADASQFEAGKWQEIAVPVHIPFRKALEFRFWPDGNHVSLDRIYVFQVKPGRPAAPPTGAAGEPLPVGLRVPDRADVIFSPYAKEGGMIDISGMIPGLPIRCPYTKKWFTLP